MHAAVVAELRADPSRFAEVQARVDAWLAEGRPYAPAWAKLLAGDRERLFAAMVEPGAHMTALRQSTPFAGVLDPRTRWAIHAAVRAATEPR